MRPKDNLLRGFWCLFGTSRGWFCADFVWAEDSISYMFAQPLKHLGCDMHGLASVAIVNHRFFRFRLHECYLEESGSHFHSMLCRADFCCGTVHFQVWDTQVEKHSNPTVTVTQQLFWDFSILFPFELSFETERNLWQWHSISIGSLVENSAIPNRGCVLLVSPGSTGSVIPRISLIKQSSTCYLVCHGFMSAIFVWELRRDALSLRTIYWRALVVVRWILSMKQSKQKLIERILPAAGWVYRRDEGIAVVVSHDGFLNPSWYSVQKRMKRLYWVALTTGRQQALQTKISQKIGRSCGKITEVACRSEKCRWALLVARLVRFTISCRCLHV